MASEMEEEVKKLILKQHDFKIKLNVKISTLVTSVTDMKHYMETKKALGDWHAVMDAAADIRELEAEIKSLKWAREEMESV